MMRPLAAVIAAMPPRRGRARAYGKSALRLVAILVLSTTSVWAGSNLNLSKSNINRMLGRGTFVTASVDVAGTAAYLLYSTPADTDFVLTQVCVGTVNGGVLLQVGGASLVQVGSGQCQSFSPGMVLPRDQAVTCTSFDAGASTFCSITGVLAPSFPPVPTPQQ